MQENLDPPVQPELTIAEINDLWNTMRSNCQDCGHWMWQDEAHVGRYGSYMDVCPECGWISE